MALISLRQLLDHAAENSYGVPAFNVNNMEQIQAIMRAAKSTDSPVILQASRGARSYAGDIFLRHLFDAAVEMYPDIPICIHQDHGNNFDTCLSAMANKFTSVMMDGSLEEDAKTPASYEYNVDISAKFRKLRIRSVFQSKASLAASVHWKPVKVRKKTATVLKANYHRINY